MSIIETKLKSVCEALQKAKGNEKKEVLKTIWLNAEKEPAVFLNLIRLLDPSCTFHLGTKSLEKRVSATPQQGFTTITDLGAYLSSIPACTDNIIAAVQAYLNYFPQDMREFLIKYLTKTLSVGVSAKTLNELCGRKIIPVMECMLAKKYFEHQKAVHGKAFTLTEKFDGIRCVALVNGKNVKLFSRQNQRIAGLTEIETELSALCDNPTMFDGELLIARREGIPSALQYKRTIELVRNNNLQKSGVTYHIFDTLPLETFFDETEENIPYTERRAALASYFKKAKLKNVELVPILYSGKDESQIMEQLHRQQALHHEGVMINLNDANYVFGRTTNLLKVKIMQDCDLQITGVQEGAGKYAGTLGALLVDYKGTTVGVGAGLDDAIRSEIWANPKDYIGRVAKIQYFEETQDKNGQKSIRFPVFLELCPPEKEVSYE